MTSVLYVGLQDADKIAAFSIDGAGKLSKEGETPAEAGPSVMAVSPDRRLLYVALTVGLVLINQPDGVAYLGIHIGLVAGALLLAGHNRFAVLNKW